jgi:hypothetical protein
VAAVPASATFPGRNGDIAVDAGDTEMSSIGTYPNGLNPVGVGSGYDFDPAWTADGQTIAFTRDLAFGDQHFMIFVPGCCGDEDSGLANGKEPTWSPDGNRIAFVDFGSIYAMNADGTSQVGLSGPDDAAPNWSPDGTKITFQSQRDGNWEIYAMSPTGSAQTRLTTDPGTDEAPNWSPDAQRIAFSSNRDGDYDIYAMNPDGSGVVNLTNDAADQHDPAWSPDGTKIAFEQFGDLWEMNAGGGAMTHLSGGQNPDWQAVPPSYVRPKGASPMYVSLVPASQGCAAPNDTHGAPLAFGSCAPPAQVSPLLTVGTPDANGRGANSIGWVVLAARAGNPATPADEADVRMTLQLTDVRRRSDLSDYTGEIELRLLLRITDNDNSGNVKPATTIESDYRLSVPCTATAAANAGGTCAVTTTLDTVFAGTIKEGKRSVWDIGQIRVFDGGPDEVGNTFGNTLFAVQGIFIR